MERKRESRARFRLGSEMEEPITGKRSKTALVVADSHSDKCHPNFFVPTIGEPFVTYKRPRYDFEKWDWMLFQWPHDRADANFEMTATDLDASFEADKKRFEEFIHGKQRQIEEQNIEMPLIELPLDQQNSTKNCTQNLLGDSEEKRRGRPAEEKRREEIGQLYRAGVSAEEKRNLHCRAQG